MTARPPRRSRRQTVPATSLPRPTGAETGARPEPRRSDTPRLPGRQVHHVTTDYGYVKTDLLAVGLVGAVTLAFIVGMSFLL